MIWEKTKKGVIEFDNGESINFEAKIPTCLDIESLTLSGEKLSNSELVRKFLLSIDGFESAEELLTTPGTFQLVTTIASVIVNSSSVNVALKNA